MSPQLLKRIEMQQYQFMAYRDHVQSHCPICDAMRGPVDSYCPHCGVDFAQIELRILTTPGLTVIFEYSLRGPAGG